MYLLIFTEVNYKISLPIARKPLIWDYSNADVDGLNDAAFSVPWDFITANSSDVNNALQNITDITSMTTLKP